MGKTMKDDYRIVLEIDDGENEVFQEVFLEKKLFLKKFFNEFKIWKNNGKKLKFLNVSARTKGSK